MLISVVIPTFNRNDLLSKCLDRLAPDCQLSGEVAKLQGQNDGGNDFQYEVIVTDDSPASLARDLVQQTYPWAKWVPGPQRGPAANRNSGASHATGDWLAFIDDDCLADSGWLKAIWENVSDRELDVVEGKTVIPDKVDNPFRQGVENLTGDNYWSCNLAVRREVFTSMGGFDEDFLEAGGEDMEFAFRIRKRESKVHFEQTALVLHPTRPIGIKQLVWRTFLIRWILLYQLKTGNGLPEKTFSAQVVISLLAQRVMGLLRTTAQLVTRPDGSMWRTRTFFVAWDWLTFPLISIYLVYWELTFRKQYFTDATPLANDAAPHTS